MQILHVESDGVGFVETRHGGGRSVLHHDLSHVVEFVDDGVGSMMGEKDDWKSTFLEGGGGQIDLDSDDGRRHAIGFNRKHSERNTIKFCSSNKERQGETRLNFG